METFTLDKIHFFRARIEDRGIRTFEAAIRYFQREHGLSRANAIVAARKTRPDLYNQFHAHAHHRTEQAPNKTVQKMSARTGRSPIQFRGL